MQGLVLYIDDVPELPDGTDRELLRVGYELVHTSDPDEGLRLIRERQPRVVLLELLLGGRSGPELLQQIRAVGGPAGEVPIVVVTRGERSPELYGEAVALGTNDFLCKPVLRAEVVAAVLECAESGAAANQVDTADPVQEAGEQESSSGDLAEEPVPEVLWRLQGMGATGVLVLQREKDTCAAQFRNGSLVSVASNRELEPIEDFLVRTKQISDDDRETVIDQVVSGMGEPHEILLGMEAISEDELKVAYARRAAEPLLASFAWGSGRYRYDPGKRLKASQAHSLDQSPERLIFDGVVQWAPPEMARQRLDLRSHLYVSEEHQASDRLSDLGPSACEPEVLESLQGDRTVAELLASAAVEARVLYALLVSGLVHVHRDPVLVLTHEVAPAPDDAFAAGDAANGDALAAAPQHLETALANLARRISAQDDFSVLEVTESSPDAEVRAAYERALAAVPFDKIPEQSESLMELAEKIRNRLQKAYEHLRDADSRQAFAALLRQAEGGERDATRSREAESWFRKGEAFLESKRYDQALEAFGMASHLDPKEGEYVAHLGYTLYLSNPTNELVQREALEHIAKGVKLSRDRANPLLFLGRIFRAKGEIENARKVLRRALKIRPDCHAAQREMRLLELRSSKRKGLLDRLRKR